MHRLLFILLLFFALSASAQEGISVKSFRCLPKDMDARIDHPVTDQNGDVAALIKVVTTETGFKFEAGSLGVVKTEQKTSEIWVYVPYGSRKITIKHPQLGVLRNYAYPEAIKKATVYEMVLTTGKVVTTVEEPVYSSQWLIIKSTPDKANVFIDDKLAGTTPFQRKYKEGEYNYRIEKSRYHNQAGKLNLSGEKKTLEFDLKPKFGNIRITSAPEKGMRIYLDDENTGETTPATLEEISSGEHRVKLQSQWYQSKAKIVSVEDEQTATLDFTMQPAFAELSVTAKPGADILIDGDQKGSGTWSGKLMTGIYTVKAEKDKYYSEDKQIEITAGKDENLSFDLKGKTGSVDVVTTPMDAKVYLDGEKQGTSPLTIKDKLIGSYEIELKKEGYGTVSQSIQIKEDETITVEEKLPQGKEVTTFAQEKNVAVVAPFDFEDKVEFMYEKLIKSKLTKIIAETDGYKAFSRTDLNAIIDEHHFQRTGLVKDDDIKKIGEMTGATHICVSDVIIADNYMTIVALIIKIETAEVEIEKSVFTKEEPEEINKGCIKLANKLVGRIGEYTDEDSYSSNTFTDSRDGKTYKTVKIGKQVWMAENLNYKTSSGSWCYKDKTSNCNKYGRLYDWETAKKACPEGWHLPSKSEFETLLDNFEGKKDAYKQLIPSGSSGFSALFGGWRDRNGNYYCIGKDGYFWSSSPYADEDAWFLDIYSNTKDSYMHYFGYKELGYSVRCLKND